ncbi:MAG: zinc ribbon domain-containing protein [Candidatus Thorarchaeota archaeon]|nr:MAG: zinc ribbon domain-containing protein [Candidatus Thorarchaeota archaeon]
MRKTLPHLLFALFFCFALCTTLTPPVHAQTWTDDGDLSFLLEVNGVSAADSDEANQIPVNLTEGLTIELTVDVASNMTLHSYTFLMQYMGVTIINNQTPLGTHVYAGAPPSNSSSTVALDSLSYGGIDLISGTLLGALSFNYTLDATPTNYTTLQEDFYLKIGGTGFAAIMSVNGLLTLAFTVMAVFSLLMALDEFQRGISAGRRLRGAKTASDVGIFPPSVVLRRRPKKDAEKVSKEEVVRRVSEAAGSAWDHKRCPQCGKKWKKDAVQCRKCGIDVPSAVRFFSDDIADYAPRALKVVKPKSKIAVGAFSKRLKLKPDKGGALAAALTDMGVFQTRSVKVPLKKVAFSGLTLTGFYWSWLQLLSGATPTLFDTLLLAAGGLVISVLVGYFMNWLARVPKLGYD